MAILRGLHPGTVRITYSLSFSQGKMVPAQRAMVAFALELTQCSDLSVLCATAAYVPGPLTWPLLFQVEIKEAGGSVPGSSPEDAAFQAPLAQESCCKFPSSQETEEASSCSRKKDSSPMVTIQKKKKLASFSLSKIPVHHCRSLAKLALFACPSTKGESRLEPSTFTPKTLISALPQKTK